MSESSVIEGFGVFWDFGGEAFVLRRSLKDSAVARAWQ